MTVEESEKYRAAVIASAKDWTLGLYPIDNQMELCIIADYYNVTLPAYMAHFYSSKRPDQVVATGAHKGILRTLNKLAKAIRQKENL